MLLPSIAKFASKHNIRPLKKFGQNFIYDESLCDKIVAASGLQEGDIVIEIGPGPAGLTRSILKKNPSHLFAIETDERCIPLLSELQEIYNNLSIIHKDAKKVLVRDLVKENHCGRSVRIISNLPYNIGTVLLVGWLKEVEIITSFTLMLQREVVDRIVATNNTKDYGRLSIICQLICNSTKCFDVSPKAFYPPPSVWSSIVHLTPHTTMPDYNVLLQVEKITNMAFSGRRKMIKSSLKGLFSNGSAENTGSSLEELLLDCNIPLTARAENLSPGDYLRLSEIFNSRTK